MRKISATYIFSLSAPPIPGGVVIVEDDGTIADVLNDAADMEDVEYYEGILCPGFVNAHCHMELSHLKGMVGQGRGLHGFVSDLQGVRELVPFSQAAFHAAERELRSGGVVAVGDVANGNSTFRFKQASGLYYHTFVEVFGLRPGTEAAALGKGLHLLKELDEMGLSASLSPHAPYSLTPELFSLLRATQRRVPLSMHNQECAAENEMFVSRSGALLNTLVSFGIDLDWFHPSGQSSLQSVMQHLDPAHKILLVHNTFTAKDDLQAAMQYFDEPYFCLCPSANLYIENTLPAVEMLHSEGAVITIGTDSYASNTHLSLFEEVKLLSTHFPEISVEDLLRWASLNGAGALGISHRFGSIEKGKRPGLNLIANAEGLRITQDSRIRSLMS